MERLGMSTKIDALKKSDVIKRVVARNVAAKAWRSVAEKEALAYLDKSEKTCRAAVLAYVREQYDAAGAGPMGRW
jgi:hypothetical protein